MRPRVLPRSFLPFLFAAVLVAGGAAAATPPVPAPHAAVQEDIRDIRGPISIPSWWPWPLAAIAGGALAAAGLVAAAVAWSRRRRPAPTPEELALLRLDQARPLVDAGRPREYAGAASDAVRWYIEQRFGLRAAHATTEEFLAELADGQGQGQATALASRRAALQQFLQACDLAKFACYALPLDGMQTLQELARGFVLTAAPSTAGRPS